MSICFKERRLREKEARRTAREAKRRQKEASSDEEPEETEPTDGAASPVDDADESPPPERFVHILLSRVLFVSLLLGNEVCRPSMKVSPKWNRRRRRNDHWLSSAMMTTTNLSMIQNSSLCICYPNKSSLTVNQRSSRSSAPSIDRNRSDFDRVSSKKSDCVEESLSGSSWKYWLLPFYGNLTKDCH